MGTLNHESVLSVYGIICDLFGGHHSAVRIHPNGGQKIRQEEERHFNPFLHHILYGVRYPDEQLEGLFLYYNTLLYFIYFPDNDNCLPRLATCESDIDHDYVVFHSCNRLPDFLLFFNDRRTFA